jgi:hypothetical protein
MAIPFTQYLLPDGRKRQVKIDVPEAQEKADEIIRAGLRFECEMLSDYITVSFTITGFDPAAGEEMDLAAKLCSNGPHVPEVIAGMIRDFDLEGYLARKV